MFDLLHFPSDAGINESFYGFDHLNSVVIFSPHLPHVISTDIQHVKSIKILKISLIFGKKYLFFFYYNAAIVKSDYLRFCADW